jgi:hypothetical protein
LKPLRPEQDAFGRVLLDYLDTPREMERLPAWTGWQVHRLIRNKENPL